MISVNDNYGGIAQLVLEQRLHTAKVMGSSPFTATNLERNNKMSNYVCQTCHRSREILVALDELNLVQGYEQCGICGSDLEYESVVIRAIHYEAAKEKAEETGEKSFQFLPAWLQAEQLETWEKRFTEVERVDYRDYRKVID